MAQSTPGTQSVPGQTPQTEIPAPAETPPPTVLQTLLDRVPDSTVPAWNFADGIPTAAVPPEHLVAAVRWLRDEADPRFDLLIDIAGSHWPSRERPFEVSYILHSLETNQRIRLKCYAGGDEPSLPSLVPLWPAANWPEREIWDMFGVTFEGHPDLRRLLNPNDWEGHPLRKDFPLGEEPIEFWRPGLPGGPAPLNSPTQQGRIGPA
jgi:NADH-quinone oxidoreductase subunit C